MFIKLLTTDPNFYFMAITLVAFSVCCHEYMHARAALWQGDDTAAQLGHLTLNPLRQMGGMALVMLFLIGITWGQVPVDPRRLRRRHSAMLVAAAGPLTNLGLFLAFAVVAAAASMLPGGAPEERGLAFFCQLGAVLNFVLFAFNLMPIPPLDGFTVFSYFFPRVFRLDSELQRGAMFLIFALVFFGFGKIWEAGAAVAGLTVGLLRLGMELALLGLRLLLGGGA